MGSSKMASKKTIGNFVAIDEIYKDHVRKEKHAQKNWEKNHGYIVEEIKNMEAKTNEQCEKTCHESDWKESLPVTVGESPSFPRTSTGMIGWRLPQRGHHPHLQVAPRRNSLSHSSQKYLL